jgi:limonene-1,2-epoxide hydrolase
MVHHPDTEPAAVLARLQDALNRHELNDFVDCFADDYDSEQPAHPDRHFRGREQVRRNWAAMFAGLPDFHAELIRSAIEGDTVWTEWRWTGTRVGAAPLDVRGVMIFEVREGVLAWARLYLEDREVGRGIGAAVSSLSGRAPS